MKKSILLCLLTVFSAICHAQQTIRTSGDNSPAVFAEKVSIKYGVRPEAVMELVNIYRNRGMNLDLTKTKAEAVVKKYTASLKSEKSTKALSAAQKEQIGISHDDAVIRVLNWQIFTNGANSPAIFAYGDVDVWYGVTEEAFRAIYNILDSQNLSIDGFQRELKSQISKYKELKALVGLDNDTNIAKLLEEGKIDEAENLLQSDIQKLGKVFSKKIYLHAGIKELKYEFDSASALYESALSIDATQERYWKAAINARLRNGELKQSILLAQRYFASTEVSHQTPIASEIYYEVGTAYLKMQYKDSALNCFSRALNIAISAHNKSEELTLSRISNGIASFHFTFGNNELSLKYYFQSLGYFKEGKKNSEDSLLLADVLSNLGAVHLSLNNFDSAAYYQRNALYVDSLLFYSSGPATRSKIFAYPDIAARYNCLAEIAYKKGDLQTAEHLLEKSLAIDSIVYGMLHFEVSNRIRNQAWLFWQLKEYDKAVNLVYRALKLDYQIYDSMNSNIADDYELLSNIYNDLGKLDSALVYIKISYSIDSSNLGIMHPVTGRALNAIGGIYMALGNISGAYNYFNIANDVFSKFPLDSNELKIFRHRYLMSKITYGNKLYKGTEIAAAQYLLDSASRECLVCGDTTLFGFGTFIFVKTLLKAQQYQDALARSNEVLAYFDSFMKNDPVNAFQDFKPRSIYGLLKAQRGIALYKTGKEKEGSQILNELKEDAIKHNDLDVLQFLNFVPEDYSIH
ncbi:MAG: tetratricopeptide repeat protein [Chitinophagaceae bacterium]|nr:tetratricopeptide repeat protein [Chitinophagaceae bacterium]